MIYIKTSYLKEHLFTNIILKFSKLYIYIYIYSFALFYDECINGKNPLLHHKRETPIFAYQLTS